MPLSAEAGFGATLDADLTDNLALVGFGEDAGGLGDIAFIGFDDESPTPAVGVVAGTDKNAAVPLRQRFSEALRSASAALRLAGLRLFDWLRYQLSGTHLRARRSRSVAIVLVGVVLSVACGVVLHKWLPARQTGPVAKALPPPAPLVKPVLVARQAIGRGHALSGPDLQWQPWPTSDVKQSYVVSDGRKIQEFFGYVARQPIAEGEPITSDGIVNPGERGALAAALPPGMRAVSVDIREETAASGLVMPGDDVDLLVALPAPSLDGRGENHYAVQTVLSNVRVLAIDQDIAGKDGRAMVGKTATLEVTPKQAEIITLARDMSEDSGNLRLTLRSLAHNSAASPASGSPERDRRDFLVESDISRLMPAPRNEAASPLGKPLTIVRGGAIAQSSPPGS